MIPAMMWLVLLAVNGQLVDEDKMIVITFFLEKSFEWTLDCKKTTFVARIVEIHNK